MAKNTSEQANQFVFRKHDSVGSAAAEEDTDFLDSCFVDTGDVHLLRDCSSPKRIIVGRTGTGKTALIYNFTNSHPNVYPLVPHDLSLNFIATNKVISFFEEAGVNLEPFYVLLWKHLLVVELLKRRFNITNEGSYDDFMERITGLLYRDAYKEMAVDYLRQWGNKFWLTTEERVRDLTERVERKLGGSVDGDLSGVTFSVEGAKSLSSEQKRVVVEHGMDAVSKVQIRELDNIITVLGEKVFNDPYVRYYITIDMLDENWADDRIRFKLIRSLIDVVRRFRSLPNVKIILALRQDLLDKVLHLENVPGFQEEKYKSLYLPLVWTQKDLLQVVEARINQMVRRHYTKGVVSFRDLFVAKVDGADTLEYLLERTFYRPRDIILFVNECIEQAADKPSITASMIKQAEERYSNERLRSLAFEWSTSLPNLQHSARLFYGLSDHFQVSELTQESVADKYADICGEITAPESDSITRALNSLYTDASVNFATLRNFILREYYITGLIGIKPGPSDSVQWSRITGHARISAGEIKPSSIIHIHPTFHRALGIRQTRH